MAASPSRTSLGGNEEQLLQDKSQHTSQISSQPQPSQYDEASPTPEFPEPLQQDDDDDDDVAEQPTFAEGSPMPMNMNQSIFGLIAAAGSRVDFNDRFDGSSSDEEDENGQKAAKDRKPDLAQTTILSAFSKERRKGHKKRLSGHRLLKSFATLPKRKSKIDREPTQSSAPMQEVGEPEPASDSSSPSGSQEPKEEDIRLPPVMSRMLEAKAEMASRPSFDIERKSSEVGPIDENDEVSALSRKLKEIFGFDEPERVIAEYPCWLLQSVLLQGFLYITAKHICFFAHLPKKEGEIAKSGYLYKSGKRNPQYSRFCFRLKGDVLSYYRGDVTNHYFPHNQIDLRMGISASIVEGDKEGVHFTLVTSHRTYNFRADSAASAKEWVKSLQRVIFRSHNDGDTVKISLPIGNIIDVEGSQMVKFSETCKIRLIDNDETFAIDEYFFSFFNHGKEAIGVIRDMVESATAEIRAAGGSDVAHKVGSETSATRPSSSGTQKDPRLQKAAGLRISEAVKSTISPQSISSSPRTSTELEDSGELPPHRGHDRTISQTLESSESNLYSSMDEPSFASLGQSAFEDPSASQILRGSEVFHSPKFRRSISSSQDMDSKGKEAATRDEESTSEALGSQAHSESQSASTPTLQSITKMGVYPLQRAGAFAGYLNKTAKGVSTLLATESMGYVEKVSGMWKGGRKHYGEPAGLRPDEDEMLQDADDETENSMERFREHFALQESERLQATYFCFNFRVLPLYGKIYISNSYFCFRSLLPGTRTKIILPLVEIENAQKENGFRFGYSGLVVVIRGHEELFFEFNAAEHRDDCTVTLLKCLERTRQRQSPDGLSQSTGEAMVAAESQGSKAEGLAEFPDNGLQLRQSLSTLPNAQAILVDDMDGSAINFKPPAPMKITCLTIGSRGDVQPYIALCKGFLKDGHKVRIATHAEFQGWIESHGIEFGCVEGDPGELMRLCIENGTFTLSFLREANATFRGWLDELLDSAYKACEGSELLIESPSAMAGIHIAEKLEIPYFRAFTMPWTRTRAYPHAFIMPENKMGGAYNYMTYVMFDNVFWKATAHQVNRWRNKTLGLPKTSLEKLQPNKVPFLYNFSPSVVAPPLDFSDWIKVTGYWFLDEGSNYTPPQDLQDFIKKARDDGKKLVYVGFGSIIVNDPGKMTQEVVDAVLKADVRCILSKGWSDRITAKDEPDRPLGGEPQLPPEIHVIKSAPHDWLFRQIDAAAHHGGSGTTGASLRAGIPTIIRPFFGDQFFFASRVEDLGVGVWVKKWSTKSFGRALWEATRNERMIIKARVLGEQIRKEGGVDTAIQCIYRDMDYAKSLIKRKDMQNDAEEEDDTEESWTFVRGDEPDPDMITTKLSEGLDKIGLGTGPRTSSINVGKESGSS